MARKPDHPCVHPGCPNLVPAGQKYCEEHKSLHPEEVRSAASRGYNSRWRRESKKFLELHPLCQECLKKGIATPATVVDHIVPHRGDVKLFWDRSNWQALCESCHDKKPDGKTRFGYVFGHQYIDVRARLTRKKAEIASLRMEAATVSDSMLFSGWMEKWMEEVSHSVKPSTFQTYERTVAKRLFPVFGPYRLAEINAGQVTEFVASLERQGLAENTIRSAFRLLNAAMRAAQEEGLIRKNPCRKTRIQRREIPEQPVLMVSQQERLREEAGEENLPALVGLYTGMRLGEICALKWEDIDWDQGTVTVRRTAQRLKQSGDGKTAVMVGLPKTRRSQRVLPIPRFLLDLFAARRGNISGNPYIFGKQDRPAEPRTVQRHFRGLAQRLGFSGVHFHTLRHTFATRLIELGVDARTVSDLMGHSSVTTTLNIYAHSLMQNRRSAIDRLANWRF